MDRRAFTLIELLVVISIIALLSSVVLASVNTAREKGRLAASRQFASQVDHIAGEQAVGIWDFNECSGGTAADSSGYGNTGILNGSPTWSTDTPSGTGCSIVLNGSTQYISTGGNNFPVSNDPYTISAWIKPNSMGVFGIMGWGNYGTMDQVTALRLNTSGPTGIWHYWWNHDIGATVDLADGKWHHVVATFDGTTRALYADGSKLSSDTPVGHNVTVSNNVTIGRTYTAEYFPGLIDAVRVYKKGLVAGEVRALYATELAKASFARR